MAVRIPGSAEALARRVVPAARHTNNSTRDHLTCAQPYDIVRENGATEPNNEISVMLTPDPPKEWIARNENVDGSQSVSSNAVFKEQREN